MSTAIVAIATPRIALGFVTYGARVNLVPRLEEAHSASYRIYVFDNSPDRAIVREACRRLSGAQYMTLGKNVGLGVGISAVCAQAYCDGFRGILFFDQDTVFDRRTCDFVNEFYERKPEVATSHAAVVFNGKHACEAASGDRFAHHDVLLAINSGSLFYLENLRRIGWHSPKYFVDCVDYEFCLNSSNHQLRIGECSTTPGFDHESEQDDWTGTVFGRRVRLRRYSAARITSTVSAGTRLVATAIISRNRRLAYAIGRVIVGYLWYQLVARLQSQTRSLK